MDREGSRVNGYGLANTYYGAELTLANLLSLRIGRVQDPNSEIHAASFGVGIAYRFKNVGGIRYDWASYPNEGDILNTSRNGVSAFFNPLALRHTIP